MGEGEAGRQLVKSVYNLHRAKGSRDPQTQGLEPGMHPRIRGAQDPKTRLRTLTDNDPGTGETQAPQNESLPLSQLQKKWRAFPLPTRYRRYAEREKWKAQRIKKRQKKRESLPLPRGKMALIKNT